MEKGGCRNLDVGLRAKEGLGMRFRLAQVKGGKLETKKVVRIVSVVLWFGIIGVGADKEIKDGRTQLKSGNFLKAMRRS